MSERDKLIEQERKPRTEGLNLEALGITLAPNGAIPVDNNLRVISPLFSHLYAIGDVNGLQMLAHAAETRPFVPSIIFWADRTVFVSTSCQPPSSPLPKLHA